MEFGQDGGTVGGARPFGWHEVSTAHRSRRGDPILAVDSSSDRLPNVHICTGQEGSRIIRTDY